MNITTLLDNIRDAVHDDSDTQSWCTTNYSQNQKVYVGIDERKPPDVDEYPIISLFPNIKDVGYSLEEEVHGISVVCGIYDTSLATTGKTNVVEYQGVSNLEAFRKYVETAIVGAVSIPQRIDRLDIEYEVIEFFPFFLCSMEITVIDPYYQGDDAFK